MFLIRARTSEDEKYCEFERETQAQADALIAFLRTRVRCVLTLCKQDKPRPIYLRSFVGEGGKRRLSEASNAKKLRALFAAEAKGTKCDG